MRSAGTILGNWFHSYRREGGSTSPGVDVVLLIGVMTLVLFGLIMVYSSSFIFAQEKTGDGFSYIRKQLLFTVLGFITLWGTSKVDYRKWGDWAYFILGFATVLLTLIFVPGIGEAAGGARRWIHLGALRFQPGEFAKFAIILFVARQIHRKADRINTITAGILAQFVVPLPALMLLLLQPDFGTTVMITLTIFALMFLGGVPIRYLLGTVIPFLAIGVWLAVGTPYRLNRLMVFLDPWRDPAGKGFQILQSFVGLHHGRLWGVGLGNGKEKLFFLPEAHNDFIASVIGEELGFVGIAFVIILYLILIHRGLRIAWNCYQRYQDRFGLLLASGITLGLGLQSFVNVAVVLGLVPTKGLNLPFISYGGSAILVDLFAVGILLSIARGPVYPKVEEI